MEVALAAGHLRGFEVLGGVRSVVFVRTTVFGIDRGWEPTDVIELLRSEGHQTKTVTLETSDELYREIEQNPNALFWPVCYTLSADNSGRLISEIFEERGVRYVGASSTSLEFSSKIKFKSALDAVEGVKTPDYALIDDQRLKSGVSGLGYPLMLKTEYSCNSEGVRRVESAEEFNDAYYSLSRTLGQRMYVESWERTKEYTAAFIPAVGEFESAIAPVGMKILTDAVFIDVPTKAASPLVEITGLGAAEAEEIRSVVSAVINALSIDGHCRIDLIRNSSGQLFVIEANFQPFMSIPKQRRSYFPNALHTALGIEFRDQVHQILAYAMNRR